MSIRGLASATIKSYCITYVAKVQNDEFRRRVTIRQRFPPTSWHAFTVARNDFLQFARNMGSIEYVRVVDVTYGPCDGGSSPADLCGGVTDTPSGINWSAVTYDGNGTHSEVGNVVSWNSTGEVAEEYDLIFQFCNRSTNKKLVFSGTCSYSAANPASVASFLVVSPIPQGAVTVPTPSTNVPVSFDVPLNDAAVNSVKVTITDARGAGNSGSFSGSLTITLV